MTGIDYSLVDVFSPRPFGGNSLAVFVDPGDLDAQQMLTLTRELRHFESIFVERTDRPCDVRARVFDLFAELPFAGHPLLGAAGVLHRGTGDQATTWSIHLGRRVVEVRCETTDAGCFAIIDQGRPDFSGTVADRATVAAAFGLGADDLDGDLPLEVVSTGLRYLVIPVHPEVLQRAAVAHDLTEMLATFGAEYAVLFDRAVPEIRHWNNDGLLEDVATGSAAGTIGAFCLRHGIVEPGELFELHQGRFVGRASSLFVRATGMPHDVDTVAVGGHVSFVGRGRFDETP